MDNKTLRYLNEKKKELEDYEIDCTDEELVRLMAEGQETITKETLRQLMKVSYRDKPIRFTYQI